MKKEIEELKDQIARLEAQIKPKRELLQKIYKNLENSIELRLKDADKGRGDFKLDELLFASTSRCVCGAGFCYPHNIGIHGSWYCSAILMGKAEVGSTHDNPLPFMAYEIKSENQPSANGVTTRPQEK